VCEGTAHCFAEYEGVVLVHVGWGGGHGLPEHQMHVCSVMPNSGGGWAAVVGRRRRQVLALTAANRVS
jgi:hypothetical protein